MKTIFLVILYTLFPRLRPKHGGRCKGKWYTIENARTYYRIK